MVPRPRSKDFPRALLVDAASLFSTAGTSATCALLVLGAPSAWANPSVPAVQSGTATFSQSGSTYTIDQSSQHAIIHWGAFGNAAGETIRFNQPNASAAVLNRVTGGNATAILGNLNADGRVFVINPNGVLVGAGAVINTRGFVASTHDVADDAFLADGDLLFSGSSTAEVTNLGSITAADGDIVLIAHTVKNSGTLSAPNGVVALGAGTDVLFHPAATDRILVQSGSATATAARGVDNTGVIAAAQAELKAAGGNVYALAVNTSGVVRATGIATRDGRVVLAAASEGEISVGGEISARNSDNSGGHVALDARTITATAGASVATGELSIARAQAFNFGAAPVTADLVRYGSFAGGTFSTFNLDNAANSIARVVMNDGEGTTGPTFASGFRFFSNRSLTLGDASAGYDGVFNVAGEGVVSIVSAGDLRLEGDYVRITARDTTATLASTGGQFVNASAGGAALATEGAGRFRVYSTSSGTHGGTAFADGGLGFAREHGVAYGSDPRPADAGSWFYFSNRLLTITAADAARVYGDANPVFTINYAGFAPGDTSAIVSGLDVSAPGATANAGIYADAITPFGATAAGYDIVFESGTLTVGRASLTVVAESDSRTYGAANPTLAPRADGLKNSDTLASLFTPTLSTAALASSGVGGYAITVSGPSQTANYDVTYIAGQLDITPAALLVTAANATRVYGDPNPAFALGSATGFVNGDTAALLAGLTFGTPATVASGVGSYAINPSLPVGLANYDVTFAPGALTITPADLFIQIDGASRVYGSANPALTGTVLSGLRNNDVFDFTALGIATTATITSGVGSYAITGATGPVGNYQPVIVGSPVLAVTPASLTLAANDATRVWGDANPTFGYTLSGMVNGDAAPLAASVGFATPANSASNVGAYAITPSGGVATSDPNYVIGAFAPGLLTIDPLRVTITADAFSRVYGDFNPAGFTGSYVTNSASASTGVVGLGGATFAGGAAVVRIGTATGVATGVGAYDFTLAAGGDAFDSGNIVATLAPASGKLSITPASLLVTPYLSLVHSTSPTPDFTDSPRAEPVTQVSVDYKPTGPEYLVTTYKQEAANNSGGVLYVKVVSTPLGADPITATNPDGTVRMQVLNTRYVSSDGVNYVRDTRAGVDNSEGSVTFDPNAARAVTIADPLPSMGLLASGLKNGDGVNFTYTTPAMAAANATYALGAPVIDAGPNYTVTVADADRSFRLDPLRLRLVLPDIVVPSNFIVPTDADQSFNIAGDYTVADFTRLYLSQIRILNRPTDAQFAAASQGTTVSASLGANPPPPATTTGAATVSTIFITPTTLTLGAGGSATTAPAIPAVGTTAIERIAGFSLANPDFIADELARVASLIKRGVVERTGSSPAELKNFYPVTPTISFANPYLTAGVEYDLTYKTILPSGALIKTPKTWSNVLVAPALPPPLPPDSQDAAAGIAAGIAALDAAANQAFLDANPGATQSTLNATLHSINLSNDHDVYGAATLPGIPAVRTGVNAFGLTSASDSALATALWAWAAATGRPLPRGEADAATIAALYQEAALDPEARAQIAGHLTSMMLDILSRQAKGEGVGADEQAFVNDLTNYVQQRQADAYNAAMAKVAQYQRDWIDAQAESRGVTQGSLVNMLNTGTLGVEIPDPPREVFAEAGNWLPGFADNDPTLRQVSSTVSTNAGMLAATAVGYGATGTAVAAMASEVTLIGGKQVGETVAKAIYQHAFHTMDSVDDVALKATSAASRIVGAAGFVTSVASTVASVLAAVITPYTEKSKFLSDVNKQADVIRNGDPAATAAALFTANPYDKNRNPVQWQQAQAQIAATGYSQAGAGVILSLMTAMICGEP